jgi:hypothetical protein
MRVLLLNDGVQNNKDDYVNVMYLILLARAHGSSWLRRYATIQKGTGSITGDQWIIFSDLPNASSRIMALGLNQPLTEISTRTSCPVDM